MVKETILKTNIPREKGWIYYTATAEDGTIILCKSEMYKGKKNKEVQK